MKCFQGIANTTDLNKYDIMFTPGALWNGYQQTREFGLPAHLGHDMHAIMGWNLPLALYFSPPRTAFVIETQCPETGEEEGRLHALADAAHQRLLAKQVGPHVAKLKERLGPVLTGAENMELPACAALSGEGLARRRFPGLFELEDEDGLVPLSALQAKAPGVFEHDGMVLFAHPFLRRSLSRLNTLNSPFLAAFQDSKIPGCIRKIRLDPNMVGLPETLREPIELAYWRGPLFNDDLASIPKGVTQYAPSESVRRLNGIGLTEFRWHQLDDERSFECEELRDTETLGAGAGSYGCRYVHTMIDSAGLPNHADGAIRMYDEAKMLVRLERDLAHAGKKTDYTKLWRIDGPIPVTLWKELVAHYYRDNPLVGEYLGGEREAPSVQEVSSEPESATPSSLPPLLNGNDGVHVTAFLRLNDQPAPIKPTVRLLDWDKMQHGPDIRAFYEADALEVLKAIRAAGIATLVQPEASRVDWGGEVFNFPPLLHEGPGAAAAVATTLDSCRRMFARWQGGGADKAVTVTLGLALGSAQFWMSCAGRLGPLVEWLGHPAAKLPANSADAKGWCNRAQAALRKLFPTINSAPGIEEIAALIRPSGALRFGRLFVNPDDIVEMEILGIMKVVVRPPPADATKLAALRYEPIRAIEILRSVCSRCGKEYADCPCTAEDSEETIEDGKTLCLTWGRPS